MRAVGEITHTVVQIEPEYLTWEQAEAYSGFSVRTVRRWVDNGLLACYRVPCSAGATRLQTRLRRRDLDALLERFRVPSIYDDGEAA